MQIWKYTIHPCIPYLHVRQSPERGKQRHSFAGARRSAQNERFVVLQPRVEQGLMPDRVDGRNDQVHRGDTVSLHLHLWHFRLPRGPLAVNSNLKQSPQTSATINCIL